MSLIGVYVGNDPEGFVQFEEWLGSEVDFVRAHGGRANWTDFVGSLGWLASQFSSLEVPIYWSVPMIVTGASLAEGAKGSYNQHYLAAARSLLATGAGQDEIHVRIGEEFNGDWMAWAAKGHEAEFIATFRQIVDTFRSVSDKFVFEWNVNIGDMGMDPAKAYPGDAYVDVIGMDFYWNTAFDPKDPEAAWSYMVNRTYGLQWFEDFAAAHGKPTAYSEWGIGSDDAGVYVRHALEWFESHNVLYQSYWNSNGDFPGMLSSGQYPATGKAFVEAFGGDGSDGVSGAADLLAVTAGGVLSVAAASGVLANDDRDATLAALVSAPAHGTLALSADGAITYVPDAGFAGTDGFLYTPGGSAGFGAPIGVAIAVAPEFRGSETGPATTGAWRTQLLGTSGADVLFGDERNNKFNAGNGADTMTGGAGDDIYVVDWNGDTVIEKAGEGIDTVYSYYKVYALSQQVENLTLYGPSGKTGIGNGMANRIEGGVGADTIDGGGGNDWLTGNGGSDVFVFGRGDGHDTITDFRTGGPEADVLDLGAFGFADFGEVRAALADTARGAVLTLPGGGAILLAGVAAADVGAGNVRLAGLTAPAASGLATRWKFGTAAADTLTGSAGNDHLDGGDGADRMTGGAGDDTYVVNLATDAVVEAANGGIDTVRSRAGSYTLAANVENLRLVATGSTGLTGIGNALDNRIDGSIGADTIAGGAGNDWLTGNAGADTFVVAPGGGHDTITDFTIGAGGDRLDLSGFWIDSLGALRSAITQNGSIATLALPDGTSVALVGVDPAALTAENVVLGGAPTPPPGTGAWTTWIGGTSGNDTLTGTAGNDEINGGSGADRMTGGKGDDHYTVDQAGDVVVEAAGEGIDAVDSWAGSHTLAANVENLVLAATYAQTGIGNGLANRITGSSGTNRIDGGGGDDWLTGGGGADTFAFSPGAGRDVVTDFDANDRIDLSAYHFASYGALTERMTERAAGSDAWVTINTGDGDAIRLLGMHLADLGSQHFVL